MFEPNYMTSKVSECDEMGLQDREANGRKVLLFSHYKTQSERTHAREHAKSW